MNIEKIKKKSASLNKDILTSLTDIPKDSLKKASEEYNKEFLFLKNTSLILNSGAIIALISLLDNVNIKLILPYANNYLIALMFIIAGSIANAIATTCFIKLKDSKRFGVALFYALFTYLSDSFYKFSPYAAMLIFVITSWQIINLITS